MRSAARGLAVLRCALQGYVTQVYAYVYGECVRLLVRRTIMDAGNGGIGSLAQPSRASTAPRHFDSSATDTSVLREALERRELASAPPLGEYAPTSTWLLEGQQRY